MDIISSFCEIYDFFLGSDNTCVHIKKNQREWSLPHSTRKKAGISNISACDVNG